MKHILVPIGTSENSLNTLQYAIDFASEIEAKVFVFRAYKVVSKAGTIINIDDIVARETNLYLKALVNQVETKNVDLKIISAKGSPTDSIVDIHNELNIDLIVLGPKSNSLKEEVFLGSTSGSIVKQTNIPVLVVPEGYKFTPFKTALTAFKSGKLQEPNSVNILEKIHHSFKTKINLLLVKTPNFKSEDSVLDSKITSLQNSYTETENMTIFQGALEHFQSNNPDLLCVFRRKRGFFQKLWESNTILKKDFYCSIPMLIL